MKATFFAKRMVIRVIVVLPLAAAWLIYLQWYETRLGADKKVQHITCVNNLKQIGIAFRIWEGDHDDQFPFNASTNVGGTRELCAIGKDGFDANTWLHFQVMSNELNSPVVLICPQDKSSKVATDWASLRRENVTYRLRSGTNISDAHPREILAVCPIDGNTVYCDGSVEKSR